MVMGQAPPYSNPPGTKDQIAKSSKATTWIVLGVVAFCGCGGLSILAAVLFPVFSQARSAAIKTVSRSNIKRIATSVIIYCADYNDKYPPVRSWEDAVTPYMLSSPNEAQSASPFRPPYKENPGSYAFNASLNGKSMVDLLDPSRTIMVFEAVPGGKNVHGGQEMVRKEQSFFFAGMGDSSARTIHIQTTDQFVWKP